MICKDDRDVAGKVDLVGESSFLFNSLCEPLIDAAVVAAKLDEAHRFFDAEIKKPLTWSGRNFEIWKARLSLELR
jgi:hypothetical protein